MKEKFREISNRVNGTFNFLEKTIPIGAGVRDYQEIYSLDFKYDGELIQLKNYLGNKSYGTIESNLSFIVNKKNFTIETKSPLARLFSFNKEIFKFSTTDKKLQEEIISNQDFKALMTLVKNTRFQPCIKGSFKDGKYSILTEYHLLLPEREEILDPLIEFHKFLIRIIKNNVCK